MCSFSWGRNYSFPHILGKVHRREDDFHFYLGDTTQTYTRYAHLSNFLLSFILFLTCFRNSAVEFSFLVLADSGAFVTQSKDLYIPADLIIRFTFSFPNQRFF